VKSDPFAPIDSPYHAKNIRALAAGGQLVGPHAARFSELVQLHLTGHEEQADQVPALEELERRQTLVDEYREQLAEEGPDAEAPTLVDETTNLYVWREGDRTQDDPEEPSGQPDGETSSGWHFAGKPAEDSAPGLAVPPRNGPGSDTETWRAFAIQTIGPNSAWATMTRSEIIAALETADKIPSGQA
jgi:hypothetical protein